MSTGSEFTEAEVPAFAVVSMGSSRHSLELYGQPSLMPAWHGRIRVSLGSTIPGIDAPFTFETGSIEHIDNLVAVLQAARDRAAGLAVTP